MSNDDVTPPPPPPSDDPTPEQGIGSLAEPPPVPPPPTSPVGAPDPVAPGIDATQMMPVVPTLPAAIPQPPAGDFGALPPDGVAPPPPGAPTQLPPEAWYRNPGAAAGILLGFLVIAGLVVFLAVASGDSDDADGVLDDIAPDAVSLVVTRLSSGGQPLNTSLSVTVSVPEPDGYTWVVPSDAVVGQAALRQTDATGRAEFRWAPVALADGSIWTSTVDVAEFIASEGAEAVEDLAVDCSLDRDGTSEDIVVDASARFDEVNDSLDTIGSYSFPNLRLVGGDRISCTSTNVVPDPAPAIPESTTTVPESTTTVPESTTTVPVTTTTVPETTTTVAETTTTSTSTTTTSTTTTTTTTTEPPPAPPLLGAFLASQRDLTDATALLDRVGLLSELEAAAEPFTIFVPTNEALQALQASADAPDFDDDTVVRALFEAHIQLGVKLDDPSTVSEVVVLNGGPQPVDSTANPITVGGVDVIAINNQVDGGVVHVLDGVLSIQP